MTMRSDTLRRIAADYGGVYVGVGVVGETWSLTIREGVARARHGAAAVIDLDPHAALAAVGVERKG